jgi:Resolvase, N terminal domain
MQVSELREYAQRRGLQVVGEYVDIASGATDSRPELNKVLALAKQRKIDTLLVWKTDRLGRSLRHLVNTIGELDAWGVAFLSLKDDLDFSTPAGRLMFNVIGAMAQFERDLIRERVRSGMANAKRKGVKLGRRRVPFIHLSAHVVLHFLQCTHQDFGSCTKSAIGPLAGNNGYPNRLVSIGRVVNARNHISRRQFAGLIAVVDVKACGNYKYLIVGIQRRRRLITCRNRVCLLRIRGCCLFRIKLPLHFIGDFLANLGAQRHLSGSIGVGTGFTLFSGSTVGFRLGLVSRLKISGQHIVSQPH